MVEEAAEIGFFSRNKSSLFLQLGLLFTALLVYATFVPLNYTPLSWSESRERWKFIPWLNLGLYSRADWIANCLVVLPSSFFLAGGLDLGLRSRLSWFIVYPIVAFWLGCIVVGMEFAQVWFPPRTVSQNDIAAGLIGILAGAWIWLLLGRALLVFVASVFQARYRSERLASIAFLAGCFCFIYAILPLDLVLSPSEWRQKISLGRLGFLPSWSELLTAGFYKGVLVAMLQSMPWGVFFGLVRSKSPGNWKWMIAFSILLEIVQIPVFTKHTTLLDVLLSIGGGIMGYCAVDLASKSTWVLSRTRLGWFALVAGVAWALGLILANTLRFDHVERDTAVITQRANDFFQYPFLRYYYTSEFSALSSILGKLISFGVLGGLWTIGIFTRGGLGWVTRWPIATVCLLCMIVSGVIEALQVFLPPLLPDINDLVLAVFGGMIGASVVGFLIAVPWGHGPEVDSESQSNTTSKGSVLDVAYLRRQILSLESLLCVAAWTVLSLLIALGVSQCWLPAWSLLEEMAGWVPASLRHGTTYVSDETYYASARKPLVATANETRVERSRKKLLGFDDFQYLGSFRVPVSYPNQTSVSNSSGGMAIRYIDGQLHFIFTSHYARGGLMYECLFPGLSQHWPYPRASIVRELGDVYQSQKWLQPVPGKVLTELSADVATGGLYYDEGSQFLYWAYGHYFNLDNPMDNSLGVSRWNAKKDRFDAVGSWGIEKIPEKFRRGGFVQIPDWFRSEVLKGDYLGIGYGGYFSIAASASFGPSLSVFDKNQLARNRVHSDIPGKMLVGYPISTNSRCWRTGDYRSEFDGGKWNPDGDKGHWAWTDGVSSAVWLDLPEHHGLFFFARLGTGRVWYEDSTLNAEGTKLVWIQYDPHDLVDVATDKKKPWDIQPVSMWDAPIQADEPIAKWEKQHGYKGTALAFISAAAYDHKTQTLFLLSSAGYPAGLFQWAPQIYAFKVAPKS